jgi:hypothetical protein
MTTSSIIEPKRILRINKPEHKSSSFLEKVSQGEARNSSITSPNQSRVSISISQNP